MLFIYNYPNNNFLDKLPTARIFRFFHNKTFLGGGL
jgi:hypothetical protein